MAGLILSVTFASMMMVGDAVKCGTGNELSMELRMVNIICSIRILCRRTVEEVEKLAEAKGQVFYRSDIVSPIMLDENTYCNLKSVGTFCSTVRGDMVDAMSHLGFYTGSNEYLFYGSNPVTNDLLGIRYVYLRDGDFYPAENDYNLMYHDDRIRVYENKYAMSIGYGVDEALEQLGYRYL